MLSGDFGDVLLYLHDLNNFQDKVRNAAKLMKPI